MIIFGQTRNNIVSLYIPSLRARLRGKRRANHEKIKEEQQVQYWISFIAVSYTHLTLPTKRIV